MFSSGNDEYGTPIDLFKKLDKEFHFTLDPCPKRKYSNRKIYTF